MPRQEVSFPGSQSSLAGILEIPPVPIRGMALFAHCFTCGKDSLAATKISRALAARGIGVLRFDFTGLGGSGGDLANAGFTGNVDDLVAAATFLTAQFMAPTLVIGHSLGGTAALAAASRIDACRAVVTIGAPASPAHLVDQFSDHLPTIAREGEADVELGGRRFRISGGFVDELRETALIDGIRSLRRALLIMHSPIDTVVDIGEAAKIFAAALHPKSFVSLDKADHLLTDPADATYVAAAIAGWAERYLPVPEFRAPFAQAPVERAHVAVVEANRRFLRDIATDDHQLVADEPQSAGGDNLGPDPYELLLAALGACTSMTLRMYANRKKWALEDVEVVLDHRRLHAEDCEGCEDAAGKLEVIRRRLWLKGDLTAEQRARLVEIADRCPVHRTLVGTLRIDTELADKQLA